MPDEAIFVDDFPCISTGTLDSLRLRQHFGVFSSRRPDPAVRALGAKSPAHPERDAVAVGATSAELVSMDDDQHGHAHDLDAARGLVPAIVAGAAVWALLFALAVLIWG
jgi:hypothetical protein